MGGTEEIYVRGAFASNWLSTVGPNITAFEEEFEKEYRLLMEKEQGNGEAMQDVEEDDDEEDESEDGGKDEDDEEM